MMAESRIFKVLGKTTFEIEDNLKKHMEARKTIVSNTNKFKVQIQFDVNGDDEAKKRLFGGQNRPRGNQEIWDRANDLRRTKNGKTVPLGMGCKYASQLIFNTGLSHPDDLDFRNLKVWIPGDWGYVRNTAFNPLTFGAGLELSLIHI